MSPRLQRAGTGAAPQKKEGKMKPLEKLTDQIVRRVSINLREFDFDVRPYVHRTVPISHLLKFCAFYGITPHHPVHFRSRHSNLAGSYFLGKCAIDDSVIYKSDIRGDELKLRGEVIHCQGEDIPAEHDQSFVIRDSFLVKTLVHSYPHDPERLNRFPITSSVSLPYANIHGSPLRGCFLGPFSTVDISALHDCIVGAFSYVQVGELSHARIDPGLVWIRSGQETEFRFQFTKAIVNKYIFFGPNKGFRGIFADFLEARETEFQRVFETVHLEPVSVPSGASLNRYALLKPKSKIGENVLVAQGAYVENSTMGKGANAQENCYVIDSHLDGRNVLAHGAKLIHARLGEKVFAGFNAFLRGRADAPLIVGEGSIIMPHTIIDLEPESDAPLEIPPGHLVWGYVTDKETLRQHSIALDALSEVDGEFTLGEMRFRGSGSGFVRGFQHRIESILRDNGAYFDGEKNRGHAQKEQHISFNIIHPHLRGQREGLFPATDIRP